MKTLSVVSSISASITAQIEGNPVSRTCAILLINFVYFNWASLNVMLCSNVVIHIVGIMVILEHFVVISARHGEFIFFISLLLLN